MLACGRANNWAAASHVPIRGGVSLCLLRVGGKDRREALPWKELTLNTTQLSGSHIGTVNEKETLRFPQDMASKDVGTSSNENRGYGMEMRRLTFAAVSSRS